MDEVAVSLSEGGRAGEELAPLELEALGTRLAAVATYLLAVCSPLLVTLVFSALTPGRSLLEPIPTWNDELVYWHGIGTFREVGLNGGYYTFDEQPARASFTHFDPHGPTYFALLGVLSALTEWTPATSVVFNLGFLMGAISLFLWVVRPEPFHAALAALLFGTSWAMPLFVPIAMQESFHQSVGIVAGTTLAALLATKGRPDWLWKVLLVGGLLIAGLVRPLWLFLLFPMVACWTERWTALETVLKVAGIVLLTGAVFVLFAWWSAPYPDTFNRYFLELLAQNPLLATGALLQRVATALELTGKGTVIEISCRQQVFLVLGLAALSLWQRLRGRPATCLLALEKREAAAHLLNLGILTVFLFCLHDIFDLRDYRTFAPHLLCSAVLLLAMKRVVPVLILILLGITTAPSALAMFRDFHTHRYTLPQETLDTFTFKTAHYLRYDPGAPNGWCNTLLTEAVHRYDFPPTVQALPPGMGFSIILDDSHLQFPVKSKYLMIDDATALKVHAKQRIELLVPLGQQKLYRNLDAPCETAGAARS